MELVIAFLIGVASSSLVGYLAYKRQKKESDTSTSRLLEAFEHQLRQSESLYSTMCVLNEQTEGIQSGLTSLRTDVEQHLANGPLVGDAKLRVLVGAIARASVPEALTVSPSSRTLDRASVCKLHATLFPKGTAQGGSLREQRVWIGSPGSTPKTAVFVPPPPAEVPPTFDELLQEWTLNYPRLAKASKKQKVESISNFHYRFVSLHPFLDGNGAMAKLLLAMQVRDLIGQEVNLSFQSLAYFEALAAANDGDLEQLTIIIKGALR